MPFDGFTVDDERAFNEYRALRNAVREAMANGVYIGCKRAIQRYDNLDAALTEGGTLETLGKYHAELSAPLAPYIAQLRQAMTAIVQIMEAVETAAPGTFNIDVPEVAE